MEFKLHPWQIYRTLDALDRHSAYFVRLRRRMIEVGVIEVDPLRAAVELAFQALQNLRAHLNGAPLEHEVPVTAGADVLLTAEQCRKVANALFPLANFARRLQRRIEKLRVNHDDPLYRLANSLQDAMQRLRMDLTYASSKRKSVIIPWNDARLQGRRSKSDNSAGQ